jgi:hypothetical protein
LQQDTLCGQVDEAGATQGQRRLCRIGDLGKGQIET